MCREQDLDPLSKTLVIVPQGDRVCRQVQQASIAHDRMFELELIDERAKQLGWNSTGQPIAELLHILPGRQRMGRVEVLERGNQVIPQLRPLLRRRVHVFSVEADDPYAGYPLQQRPGFLGSKI